MFSSNRNANPAPLPDPREQHFAMQEKLAAATHRDLDSRKLELNRHAIELHKAEMKLDERFDEFEKHVAGRLDEFRTDLDLMAKFQGMRFETIPSKRALTSIDGPDPRKVAQAQVAAAVTDQVTQSVGEMLVAHSDDIDEQIDALKIRLRELADLFNSKKKR